MTFLECCLGQQQGLSPVSCTVKQWEIAVQHGNLSRPPLLGRKVAQINAEFALPGDVQSCFDQTPALATMLHAPATTGNAGDALSPNAFRQVLGGVVGRW